MIFFFNAQGALIKSVPTDVYQGSNKASRIWVLMPTASTNIVNVAFTLPNGKYAPQRLMTNGALGTGIVNGDKKFVDELGQPINAWYYDIKTDVTSYAGNITAQFFVTTPSDDKSDSEIITTQSVNIIVLKGTPLANIPAPIDEYQEIIKVLASINATVVNIKNDVDNFKNETVENLEEQFNELEVELNNKFNDLEKNSTASQVIQNTNNIKALFNLQLNKNVLAYDNAEFTEEMQQTGGVELNDYAILDNSYATVNKISGDTVRCENLISYPYDGSADGGTPSRLTFPITRNGVTFTDNNGIITANGTATNEILLYIKQNYSVKQGEQYSLSGCPSGGSLQTYRLLGATNVYANDLRDYGDSATVTMTADDTISVCINIKSGTVCNNLVFKPMFNKGSILQYQPFFTGLKHAQISGIKSIGRNLWDGDGGIVGRTFMDGTEIVQNNTVTMWAIPIPKNTPITFTMKEVNATPNGTMYIAFANDTKIGTPCYKDNNLPAFYDNWDERTINNVDYKYLLLCCYSTLTSYFENNLQLNLGSTALPYEPYTESVMQLPEVTNPDGTVGKPILPEWDYIQNGQIVRQTETVIFDGTESWSLQSINNNGYANFRMDLTKPAFVPNEGSVCNYYDYDSNGIANVTRTGFLIANLTALYFRDNNYTTVDEWEAHLAKLYEDGTPLTLSYQLATPTYEPITFNNKYLVWDNGIEQVITPTDERGLNCFDHGSNTTEENNYYVIVGGNE